MSNQTAQSTALQCRQEAHRTDCADTRTALLSIARALEAVERKSRRRTIDAMKGAGTIWGTGATPSGRNGSV